MNFIESGLSFEDAAEKRIAYIGESDDDSGLGRIEVLNRGVPSGTLLASRSGGALQIGNAMGAHRVSITIDSALDDAGLGRFFNSANRETISLGVDSKQHGKISVADAEGQAIVRIGSNENETGGIVTLSNRTGVAVVTIGTADDRKGMIEVNGERISDFAEVFELKDRDHIMPGTVVAVTEKGGGLVPTTRSYDKRVVGVVCGANSLRSGIVIGTRKDGSTDLPVAVAGQVILRVSLEGGPIEAGDLLVSSNRLGVAMRASDFSRAFGAVIGKALEPYRENPAGKDEGLVRMLVMTR